jgi:hypothetical protein
LAAVAVVSVSVTGDVDASPSGELHPPKVEMASVTTRATIDDFIL